MCKYTCAKHHPYIYNTQNGFSGSWMSCFFSFSHQQNILMFSGPAHVHPNGEEAKAEAHHQGKMNCKVLLVFC